MNEKQVLNKQLLVGQATLNGTGKVQVQFYKHGTIRRFSNVAMLIERVNGEDQIPLPSSSDVFRKVPRGQYTINSTGETVKNPDFLLIQPGELVPPLYWEASKGIQPTRE